MAGDEPGNLIERFDCDSAADSGHRVELAHSVHIDWKQFHLAFADMDG